MDGGTGWGGGRPRRAVAKLEEMHLSGAWDAHRAVTVGMWSVLLRGLGLYPESNGKALEGFKWHCPVATPPVENHSGHPWFPSESVRRQNWLAGRRMCMHIPKEPEAGACWEQGRRNPACMQHQGCSTEPVALQSTRRKCCLGIVLGTGIKDMSRRLKLVMGCLALPHQQLRFSILLGFLTGYTQVSQSQWSPSGFSISRLHSFKRSTSLCWWDILSTN